MNGVNSQVWKEFNHPLHRSTFALPFLILVVIARLLANETDPVNVITLSRVLFWMGTIPLTMLTWFSIARQALDARYAGDVHSPGIMSDWIWISAESIENVQAQQEYCLNKTLKSECFISFGYGVEVSSYHTLTFENHGNGCLMYSSSKDQIVRNGSIGWSLSNYI